MSLRTRITLYGIAVVTGVLVVISALFLLLIAGSVPQNQDNELATRAEAVVAALGTTAAADLVPQPLLAPVDVATSNEIVTMVLDERGAVLVSTGVAAGLPPSIPTDLLDRARADGAATATISPGATGTDATGTGGSAGEVRLRAHVRPWQRADLGRSGYAVAAQALRRQQTDRQDAVAVLIISGLGSLIAAAVGIWLVAGRALRPLRQLTAMADEIGRSADLSRRLGGPAMAGGRRDDLGRLTASFNTMMARLEDAYRRMVTALAAQQRFTADASHELRTPLTTVRSSAGFLRTHPDAAEPDRAAALADIESESARMSRLVDDLLTLARADSGHQLAGTTVDLGELAHEVCRQASGQHATRNLHCAGAPVPIVGDADALRRLLWILIDNAVGHTADGGHIWVAVTSRGSGAILQVSDDGPGIPAGLHERIFDRFFRVDESRRRGGAGLGLSIARWIVRSHGGEITASNHERGGASFIAELPGMPQDPPTEPHVRPPA